MFFLSVCGIVIVDYSNFAGAKWPSARWQSGVPGMEKDIRQSIRPDIPMSPKASSVSDEADTLDAFGLISMVNY